MNRIEPAGIFDSAKDARREGRSRVARRALAASVALLIGVGPAPLGAASPSRPGADGMPAPAPATRIAQAGDGRSGAYEAFQRRQQERYRAFQEQREADYEAFMERIRAQYERFTGIVEQVESEERDRLREHWAEPELSSQKVWVEYSDDLRERTRVDFETGELRIETIGGALDADARAALRARVRAVVTKDRAQAFAADRVAQEVERRSRKEIELLETAEVEPTPVLWPYLTGEAEVDPAEIDAVVEFLVARAQIEETQVSGERMQSARIPLDTRTLLAQLDKLQSGGFAAPMPDYTPQEIPRPTPRAPAPPPREAETAPAPEPPRARTQPPAPAQPRESRPAPAPAEPPRTRPQPPAPAPTPAPRTRPAPSPAAPALPVRARPFLAPVQRHGGARSLDLALVFSIIETESAFNPLARSHVPAFGLMQIVPRSAGQDASAVLFGKPRILAPSYLYNAEKNIEVGAVYLDILFNRYLSGIRNERSRLYCVIAAYNTGAGNVFRAFTGKTRSRAAYQKINAMSPEQVYRHLIWNLPHRETRQYLARVVDRMEKYRAVSRAG